MKKRYDDDRPFRETGNALVAIRKREGINLKTAVEKHGGGIARSTAVAIESGTGFNFRYFPVVASIYGITPRQLFELYGLSDSRLLEDRPGQSSEDPAHTIGRTILSLSAESQQSVIDFVEFLVAREQTALAQPDLQSDPIATPREELYSPLDTGYLT